MASEGLEGLIKVERINYRMRIQFPHNRKNTMKASIKQIATLAFIVTFATALTATAEVQTAKGGAQQLLGSTKPPTEEIAVMTAPAAMLCPNCHNETMSYVTTSRGGVKEYRTVVQHLCPGCRTRIGAIGHGKPGPKK